MILKTHTQNIYGDDNDNKYTEYLGNYIKNTHTTYLWLLYQTHTQTFYNDDIDNTDTK